MLWETCFQTGSLVGSSVARGKNSKTLLTWVSNLQTISHIPSLLKALGRVCHVKPSCLNCCRGIMHKCVPKCVHTLTLGHTHTLTLGQCIWKTLDEVEGLLYFAENVFCQYALWTLRGDMRNSISNIYFITWTSPITALPPPFFQRPSLETSILWKRLPGMQIYLHLIYPKGIWSDNESFLNSHSINSRVVTSHM